MQAVHSRVLSVITGHLADAAVGHLIVKLRNLFYLECCNRFFFQLVFVCIEIGGERLLSQDNNNFLPAQ